MHSPERDEMTSSNHTHDRALQQDARAWADFAGVNYIAALRQLENPLLQGILGNRVSTRHLIQVLDEHLVIGAKHTNRVFGYYGLDADSPMRDNLPSDALLEVGLSIEFLRMFTQPTADGGAINDFHGSDNSYALKHTAEDFLGDAVDRYVSNGALIWAAAALGLPMRALRTQSPNVEIALSMQEHRYVDRFVAERDELNGHHFQPPGFARLRAALDRVAAGQPVGDLSEIPMPDRETSTFHDWLARQVDPHVHPGLAAHDYIAGVESGDHRAVESPEDYLQLMQEVRCSDSFYRSAEQLVRMWHELSASRL